MIGKISHGNSFGGCLDYLTRVKQDKLPLDKRVWSILDSDGARLEIGTEGWRKMAASDIKRPTLTRNKIKNPCGHISLGFSPEDAPRMTDEFMLEIAREYMDKMGIADTPFVIVRHTDKEHPHCHIMFSRVDNNGKIIKPVTNFNRNRAVCADITERHNLTMGSDSLNLNPEKLRGSERSRVEIIQAATEVLNDKSINEWKLFRNALAQRGIEVYGIFEGEDDDKKLKSIIYKKGRHSFVASKIGKRFTQTPLFREFRNRREAATRQHMATTPDPNNQWIHLDGSPIAPTVFGDMKITPEQQQLYVKGYTIHVGDAYIRFNPDTKQPDVSRHNLDILSGGGMPFAPGAHPEYEAFYNGLSGFDKEAFKRFRRSHPTLTNQEALSMFKMNNGQSQRMGMGHHL